MAISPGPGLRSTPDQVAQFRSALWSAGYQTERVSEVLGADRRHLQPDPAQSVLLGRQLPSASPLSTLIRLFILGLTVPEPEAAAALAPLTIEHAAELGVIRGAAGGVEGAVRITPYAEFLFACSRVPELHAVDPGHVMGVTNSSINLANLTIRRPVGLALDVGCGCGFQALFAARHASRVIAVDVNPVALQFTEFNARLNGFDNIECREGDYLEPVAGEAFDLIVANPPFVISPESRFLYRDSGLGGDELCRRLSAEVPAALREGGTATMLVSWGRRPGEAWDVTPRRWLEGSGSDAWVFHLATQPAQLHAASWHQILASQDVAAYGEGVARWTDYITGLGFDSIAYGALVWRRRQGSNWVRAEDLPSSSVDAAGEQLLRMTAAQDLLAGLAGRSSLLDQKLRLVDGHRLDQTLHCRDGAYSVESAVLRQVEGLGFSANVDAFNAYLLTRLDGSRSLREAIAEAAGVVPPDGLDEDEVEPVALRSARRMCELGFIEVAAVR